jgi:glycosyltransferase involved in cell wall biosynthesis
MQAPLITVLITTYNYGRFIEEAIDSVLSEDFPQERVEIVVVDDGSTDDTAERVKKYGSRIRYFQQANGGQAAALNAGFAEARGEIVALLDADDSFLPGKLARIEEAFERAPGLGMVYHRMVEWNMETNERRETRFPLVSGDVKTMPDLFLFYEAQATSCISFRRASLSQLLPIPGHVRMLADGYLVDLMPFRWPILAIPEALAVYRIHGKNCFYTDDGKVPAEVRKSTLETRRILVDAMRKWLADNGYTKKQLPVRMFLEHWELYLESEGFLIEAPSRLNFFWWRVRRNRTDSIRQTWRFTFFNYLTACLALIFGYTKADAMYEWRTKTLETTKRIYRKFGGAA